MLTSPLPHANTCSRLCEGEWEVTAGTCQLLGQALHLPYPCRPPHVCVWAYMRACMFVCLPVYMCADMRCVCVRISL